VADSETFDVVVVGSGAAGAMTALRLADKGLTSIIIEKAQKFGGTSAVSGGVMWLPNHRLDGDAGDSRELSLEYLDAIITKPVNRERLETYVDTAGEMAHYLKGTGVELIVAAWPDYEALKPGARTDRAVIAPIFDGRELGDDRYPLMREQFNRFKLFGRYSLDLSEMFPLMMQQKGWRQTAAKVIARYWVDRSTRSLSRRDRRFVQGAALMGRIFQQVFKRGIEIRLDTTFEQLVVDSGGRVTGVEVSNFGRPYTIHARHGVMLAAGGFEWNQELRDRFFPFPGLTRHSSSPEDMNRGEGLIAAVNIGAATEHTEEGWFIPTMTLPSPGASNFHEIHQAAFDVGRPWSVCVNRNGVRFVDEACGYDQFGQAMIRDHKATGANLPCWHVFDTKFRRKFSSGGLMPLAHTPERKIPSDWWGHYVFRDTTIEGLARQIKLPVEALAETIRKNNEYAKTGIDPEFGKGMNIYDQFFGDPASKPNPNIGPIDTAPYYAVPIHAGDLGTKGGLKCDARSRVLDGAGNPIAGLYAAGNQSGTPFGYIAANDIAERSGNQRS
jgi:3-oxosteroid 1-dehydrogenase